MPRLGVEGPARRRLPAANVHRGGALYTSCIFCSRDLGRNAALETFPVGATIAFDGWKGRLWAVCQGCGRWNLAPIEERWEAVEHAEERFRRSRQRFQSENVGVARLDDGTRLVRIGDALPGELAAWRYGGELTMRRRRHRARLALQLIGDLIAPGAYGIRTLARKRETVYRYSPLGYPSARTILVREKDLHGVRVLSAPDGGLQIVLHSRSPVSRRALRLLRGGNPTPQIVVSGFEARDLLCRAMVRVNAPGASAAQVEGAVEVLARFSTPERLVAGMSGGALTLTQARLSLTKHFNGLSASSSGLPFTTMLALEMSLHEESERRALSGELAELRRRWREAEEIAEIADLLPADPLEPAGP